MITTTFHTATPRYVPEKPSIFCCGFGIAVSGQAADGGDDVLRRMVHLAATAARKSEFSVNPSLPVNMQDDLGGRGIDVGDDFFDQRANDAFFQPYVGIRCASIGLQISGQVAELLRSRSRTRLEPAVCSSSRCSSERTCCKAAFQRRSNSSDTKRLSGSQALNCFLARWAV